MEGARNVPFSYYCLVESFAAALLWFGAYFSGFDLPARAAKA